MTRRIVQAIRSSLLFALVMVAGWAAGCRSRAPANPGGLDGAAGSAGSEAGGGGGMRASTVCPTSAPTAGTPCQPPSICQYGSDPRGRDCRTYAECGVANTWTVTVPTVGYPSYCVPITAATSCPASVAAAQGQSCSTDFSFCDIGGAPCICTACPWNGGRLGTSCGTAVTWHCQTQRPGNSPDCPVLDPNPGASCSSERLSCTYYCGPTGNYVCQGGYWVAGDAGLCPV
jgi:hypothetical protein